MLLNMENAPSPMRESVNLLLKFWIDISNNIIINRLKGLVFFYFRKVDTAQLKCDLSPLRGVEYSIPSLHNPNTVLYTPI